MLSRMESRHITEWNEFLAIDPQGEIRSDYRNASLMALVASMFGTKKHSPKDFMPKFGANPKRQTEDEMRRVLEEYAEKTCRLSRV